MVKQIFIFTFMVLGFSIILGGCGMDSSEKKELESEVSAPAFAPDSYDLADYEEVFFDDFDGENLNLSNWGRCPEWQRQDHGGYWKNDCSYLKDGNLVLEARRGPEHLESGAIRSRGKFMQVGGAYQIRFKAEKKSGLWSAFWLMYGGKPVVDGTAKTDGEIDIFEIISNDHGMQYLNSATHWDGYEPGNHKSKGVRYKITDDFYDKWHTVTFFWGNEYYVSYLDDSEVPYWKGKVSEYGGPAETPHYIKITSEFGKWNGPVKDEELPSYFLVDWVKAYKRK
ncbi:MAG: glycoside hydrolase family 16 protein [Treponema sp.]|nr:glycoside hydrolase family 16 protein [Treponema sp.]